MAWSSLETKKLAVATELIDHNCRCVREHGAQSSAQQDDIISRLNRARKRCLVAVETANYALQ
jgi:hypothetical protein